MDTDAQYKNNDRLEDRIPAALMLTITTEQVSKEISVYDLLANHLGLRYLHKDIYVNEAGEEYIRTRYGFQSAIRYNQNVKISESEHLIAELEYKLKIAKEKTEQFAEIIKALEAKSKERKEKLKKMTRPFQFENEALRREIKSLKKELNEFKQVNESVINKLTKLSKQTNDTSDIESSSKLDWSSYTDIFDDKE
jgi:tRNA/tmRNA/rRNA uracil-C5-methylase (TrmA/RlmC/RlmD family)